MPLHAVLFISVQGTQAPALVPERLHAGEVGTRHSLSAMQARQVRLLSSHTGVVPLQSLSLLQLTQRFVSGLQTVDMPVHCIRLSGVHCTQRPMFEPESAHAGVEPEQSLSARHARQVLLLRSQMGVAPPQSVLLRH